MVINKSESRLNIVVAMSGGVDSSVAAALLAEAGHRVMGATLCLLRCETGFGCCGSSQDIEDARAVCATLNVPHYVLDFSDAFEKNVLDPFVDSYLSGKTPNPCIACNRFIKFDALLKKAVVLGADTVATGHYARIVQAGEGDNPRWRLRRANYLAKDQSYVLYHLGQAELARLVFPVGDLTKDEVREAARRFGLKTADKRESMEICFVPGADAPAFVKSRAEATGRSADSLRPGPIKDREGRVIGAHRGAAFYTRGQREGLGLSLGRPAYVVSLDTASNTVVVGEDADTLSLEAEAGDVVWSDGVPPAGPVRLSVQIRSRHGAAPALVTPTPGGARILFGQPQRAVTPGQSAVFYEGEFVVGGGAIAPLLEEKRK